MIGCSLGRLIQLTIAGGSYQDGLTSIIQGLPSGMYITEKEIYGDLLLRKPGADELSSPRKEPDLPVIYTGVNAADTVDGANNAFHTNGTPLSILIPNLDRHFIHIKQYQDTNRTPRPGHASYASFHKYGPYDDAIGAGIFSGRYSSAIVAGGYTAKQVLKKFGIEVFSYVRELAGVSCSEPEPGIAFEYCENYKQMRKDYDPFFQNVYMNERIRGNMRFLEKMTVFSEIEKEIDDIRKKQKPIDPDHIRDKYGVHHILNCPDLEAADEMVKACNFISKHGDSAGGIAEVVITGAPIGLGEPVFDKLDAELGRMLGIGSVKGVEVGAGFNAKNLTGFQNNDQMISKDGKVIFESNNAGGILGGLSTGQNIVARVAVKGTPTIDKPQKTIDKYTNENKELEAITRRDPTIVARIWPVIENYVALVMLDHLFMHYGYQALCQAIQK
jgi:chorismate synthase